MPSLAKPRVRVPVASAASQRAVAAYAQTRDSFQNFQLRLGQGTSNALTNSTYGFNPITRVRQLLEWMYRGSWVVGQVIDTIAEDMTKAGIEMTGEIKPEDESKIQTSLQGWGVWSSLNDVIKWGRLYGGCLGVIMIDGQDPKTPLNVDRVQKDSFRGILSLDRWMVQPSLAELVEEPGPDMGNPMYYDVTVTAPGIPRMRVHYTRVIRVLGIKLPYWQAVTENLWGESVIERLYDRLIAFDSTTQGVAQLVYKAHLRAFKIENLREIMSAGGPAMEGLAKQMESLRYFQANEGVSLLDAKDDFQTHSYAFAGLDSVLLQFGQQLSGATQIPLVRLFGQSPAGLNSTGESDMQMYYDGITQKQNSILKHGMEAILRVAAASEGITLPDDFGFDFVSLWEMDDVQKAEVASKVQTAVSSLVNDGIISRKTALMELKQSSRKTNIFSNITDEEIEQAEDEVPEPGELMPGEAEAEGLPGSPEPGEEEEVPAKDSAWEKDPRSDKEMNISKPFASKAAAEKFAASNGLGKSAVRSRPGGYVVERPSTDALYTEAMKHFNGLRFVLENPKGSERTGKDAAGVAWTSKLGADYGYVLEAEGADGDKLDAFMGPSSDSKTVWVIDQRDPDSGAFDEHKCMLGYSSQADAIHDYVASYNDGRGFDRIGGLMQMDASRFAEWVQGGSTKEPLVMRVANVLRAVR